VRAGHRGAGSGGGLGAAAGGQQAETGQRGRERVADFVADHPGILALASGCRASGVAAQWRPAGAAVRSYGGNAMDMLVLIGRILFVPLFLNSAIGHLTQSGAMGGYAASKGVPMPRQSTLASGAVLLAGGLMVLFGVWADLGALLLVVFLIPTAVLMHPFWKETDSGARQGEMIHFLKDMALAGAALMLFALFSFADDDLGLTLTGPLFNLD
jgi:uncharacterized membrane protein YphA (DoxX/SURF4 family)